MAAAEALSVEGVWKGFSCDGRWTGVLEDVSFDVGRGEVVAIVGGRLRGKTTLLRVAAGIERPDKGEVSLGSRRLAVLRDRAWARLLGHEIVWVSRDGPRLEIEVSKFVGWPQALHGHGRRGSEELAARALERVGAKECIGRRWAELSNWQKVLVGLARGFAGSPHLVIIDDLLDALSGRDTEQASDLLRSLIEESEPRCGVLMSASEEDSAIFADQEYRLTRGGGLKLLSGRPSGGAEVKPFPEPAESRDSPGVGCP